MCNQEQSVIYCPVKGTSSSPSTQHNEFLDNSIRRSSSRRNRFHFPINNPSPSFQSFRIEWPSDTAQDEMVCPSVHPSIRPYSRPINNKPRAIPPSDRTGLIKSFLLQNSDSIRISTLLYSVATELLVMGSMQKLACQELSHVHAVDAHWTK